jgi:hypothetical protein
MSMSTTLNRDIAALHAVLERTPTIRRDAA